MDLEIIKTHLDNFVDTWKGWSGVFDNVADAFKNLNLLSSASETTVSDLFPKTAEQIEK